MNKMTQIAVAILATAALSAPVMAADGAKEINNGMQKRLDSGKQLPAGWQKRIAKGQVADPQVVEASTVVSTDTTNNTTTLSVDNFVYTIDASGVVTEILMF